MMDIAPNGTDAETPLQKIIRTDNSAEFETKFLEYTNEIGSGPGHDIQFNASYSCRDSSDNIRTVQMISSRNLTGGEHAVRATKWIIVNKGCAAELARDRAVLVEVLLWRD
jgi:hypothetical protein